MWTGGSHGSVELVGIIPIQTRRVRKAEAEAEAEEDENVSNPPIQQVSTARDTTTRPYREATPTRSPLSNLTDRQLVTHAEMAMRREHRSSVAVLDALAELDRRSVYLDHGYSSLFDFCTRRWRYSAATAARYIAASRAAVRFPRVRELLLERRLTVCGLARLAKTLTEQNSRDLLERAADCSYAEIEALVASGREAPRIPDRVRVVGTSMRKPSQEASSQTLLGGGERTNGSADEATHEAANESTHEPANESRVPNGVPGVEKTALTSETPTASGANIQYGCGVGDDSAEPELRYEIRFSATQRFVNKLERAKAICSSRADLEAVLERALDDLLERRDPEVRIARRVERTARKARADQAASPCTDRAASSCADTIAAVSADVDTDMDTVAGVKVGTDADAAEIDVAAVASAAEGDERAATMSARSRSRHIPVGTRDTVFRRDGGRCTYVGPSGVRCDARVFLQYDHVLRFSDGGGHGSDNLRLLCGRHNRRREEGDAALCAGSTTG
ncbi:MAG: HNH endonuclease [Candidatus Eisenbacteria bacterium]|uniref:HNH endonuclease n=1 Tax=Eiseniibacteriota bacterium TaxID=2212470 RepID=A0A956NIJ8_UNCEI|nr:HNH endonuclease [Candidatus Eisenbacteria bacterium]